MIHHANNGQFGKKGNCVIFSTSPPSTILNNVNSTNPVKSLTKVEKIKRNKQLLADIKEKKNAKKRRELGEEASDDEENLKRANRMKRNKNALTERQRLYFEQKEARENKYKQTLCQQRTQLARDLFSRYQSNNDKKRY